MTIAVLAAIALISQVSAAPQHSAELVFPLHDQHNHAPGIVECPNGDLLVSWYRGSGERSSDDVAVFGARKKHGEAAWSEPFVMADTPGFPDCNTCMMIDDEDRLWLFWPTIIANTWESCLTNYRTSREYSGPGSPTWERNGLILLKPNDFSNEAQAQLDKLTEKYRRSVKRRLARGDCNRQKEIGRQDVPAARLATAVQADRPAKRSHPFTPLHRHVFDIDHGRQRR